MVEDNVDRAIKKMDKIFKNWTRRSLSTLGKILIAKTFGISQLIHVMQSLVFDKKHYVRINKTLYKFIWNRHYNAAKAPERIKREFTNKPIKLGGLGMLDIEELDMSLKIKSLGRLLQTEHPFLKIIKEGLDMSHYLLPSLAIKIDRPTNLAIECISKDRLKLLDNPDLQSNRLFLGLVKSMTIFRSLNTQGRQSIAFNLIRREGKQCLGDLTQPDLHNISRFLNRNLATFLTRTIGVPGSTLAEEDNLKLFIKDIPKSLTDVTSKEIRLSRTDSDPICIFKCGVILNPNESINYFFNVSRLKSVKHKNLILKILHGDIYTNEKLFKYGMVDSPLCPRCNEVETLEHKFATCQYVNRIWLNIFSRTRHTPRLEIDPLQDILNASNDLDPLKLLIHSEILNRINLLNRDQDYLTMPKIVVTNAIKYLIKMERSRTIKENLKNLL
jgi:hypothetical protein